jgi:small neutral amino acid transporter SnatA (MarC family)
VRRFIDAVWLVLKSFAKRSRGIDVRERIVGFIPVLLATNIVISSYTSLCLSSAHCEVDRTFD